MKDLQTNKNNNACFTARIQSFRHDGLSLTKQEFTQNKLSYT